MKLTTTVETDRSPKLQDWRRKRDVRSLAFWGIALNLVAAVLLLIDNLYFAVQSGYGSSYPHPRIHRLVMPVGWGLLVIGFVLQLIAAWS
jgi:hypothetical protein